MRLLDRSGWKSDPARLVSLAEAEPAIAAKRPGERLGAIVPNDVPAASLAPLQDRLDLIAIEFPAPGDGRGFSLARSLREQGYAGTLRASGQLIPDQFAFALAAGFDEIEIDEERAARQPAEQWLAALVSVSDHYQGPGSIFAARRSARG